jgi:hypothetical protein
MTPAARFALLGAILLAVLTTPTGRTDRSISTRPQAALPRPPERPFGRCDEIDSMVSCTSICRSRDVPNSRHAQVFKRD